MENPGLASAMFYKMTDTLQERPENMISETSRTFSDEIPSRHGSAGKRKREDSPSDQVPESKHHEIGRRKSQRRSSFVRGRRSIQLPSKHRGERDFTQEIDPNLPSEERLARLYSAALEFSLEKVCREFEEFDGMQQFKIEGRERGNDVIAKLESAGAFKEATTLKKGLLNPKNIEVEEGIASLEAYRDKLKSESEDWDRILQERTRLSEQAERKVTDEDDKVLGDIPTTLTTEQKALLESAPNYNSIHQFITKIHTEVDLFNTELQKKCELISKCRTLAEGFVLNQAKIISNLTTDKSVQVKTPRTLLSEFANE